MSLWLALAALTIGAPPSEPETPVPEDEEEARLQSIEARISAVEGENQRLREALEGARAEQAALGERADAADQRAQQLEKERAEEADRAKRAHAQATERNRRRFTAHGYLDVGFFYVSGDGRGFRSDPDHTSFPEFAGVIPDYTVFMGDPLSTAINTRGEPADTSGSEAVKFDAINNGGRPSFIVNALNLNPQVAPTDTVFIEGLVDFVPRQRDVSDSSGVFLGDFVDLKLAYVRWKPKTKGAVVASLYAGKIESVFGREYRRQESPSRMGVTPSLICRYTCGRPVGLKARLEFLRDQALVWNTSLTNGSTLQERFGLSNEVDVNFAPTGTTRLSYDLPVGAELEFGMSGMLGAQDLQDDDGVGQAQFGFDAYFETRGFSAQAEYVRGAAEGRDGSEACSKVQCLRYHGAYLELAYRATNWLVPYARADYRNALHQDLGFVYFADLVRATPGLRFELGTHVAVKVEYTFNWELGRVLAFPNDIFTSSAVAYF
jgi:hypothetical protein